MYHASGEFANYIFEIWGCVVLPMRSPYRQQNDHDVISLEYACRSTHCIYNQTILLLRN